MILDYNKLWKSMINKNINKTILEANGYVFKDTIDN